MKLHDLRERAKKELGPKFDVRKFHDEVLGAGALPLDVHEKRIDGWIAAENGMAVSGGNRAFGGFRPLDRQVLGGQARSSQS